MSNEAPDDSLVAPLPDSPVASLIRTHEVERFLRYYQPALEACEAKLVLFTLPGATTFTSRDIEVLARQATEWAQRKQDVYLHVQLHDLPDGLLPRRGSLESVRAAIGLFADIDARGPGRNKSPEKLCPTVADAVRVADLFNVHYKPLQVSALVSSGYGCYPLVAFKEPFVIDTPADKRLLESLSRRFHLALHTIAVERGWNGAVDYCDPAKVLRLPGCVNWKNPTEPKPVELVYSDGTARFNLSDLEEFLPQASQQGNARFSSLTEVGQAAGSEIVLNPNVEVPPGLLEALGKEHRLFRSTWDHERSDLDDDSCSGYELALASIGVACGLTDQQIADLLIVHRRKFPATKRSRRGQPYLRYLSLTIGRARAGKQSSGSAAREWAEFRQQLQAGDDSAATSVEHPEVDQAAVSADTDMTEGSLADADHEPEWSQTNHGVDAVSQQFEGQARARQENTARLEAAPVLTALQRAAEAEPLHPYREKNGGMVRIKISKDGSEEVIPLTNFTARITSNIGEDDGVEVKRFFGIDAQLAGNSYAFIVPAHKFATMDWPIENIGPRAIVHPNQKEWAKVAIQSLSDKVLERRIYTHTGWRRVGDSILYLHGGGAIGDRGAVPDVDVRLAGALVHYALDLPASDEQLGEAVRASLRVLEVAPDHITCPVGAAVYRACIKACDFAVWLGGPTGVFKSEIAALAQQHYGTAMNARRLPGNFASTGNALESLAFSCKDSLLVIDDFAPHGGVQDVARYHAAADRILRAAGNNQGRGRLSSDARLREAKPPRGLILATGEDMPRGQSIRGRTLIVEVAPGDVHTNVLTECQVAAASGAYARAMGGFVQWLAGQHDKIQAAFQARVLELRSQATKAHSRTPGIVADLYAGFELFLQFAATAGAITGAEQQALAERCWQALNQAAKAQRAQQDATEPTQRFLALLRAAILSGQAYVGSLEGGAPAGDGQWGWQLVGSGDRERLVSRGKCVGWLDGSNLYLEPTASFGAAQELGRATGEPLVVSQTTLNKRLREKGLLVSTDPTRGTLTVRRRICGESIPVLHLRGDALGGPAEVHPAPPAGAQDVFEC